jgi:hypothetical protein
VNHQLTDLTVLAMLPEVNALPDAENEATVGSQGFNLDLTALNVINL